MNITDSEIRTKGSLCSGTGALDSATPGELAWVAETNEAAAAVLKREHPDVPNLGDITTLAERNANPRQIGWGWSVDLLTSGDPCQSMSAAGRQMASADERFLWPDVMRVIRYLRPRYLFLENVQNLQSVALVKGANDWRGERGSVLKLRLDNLREDGYAVKWTVLGACAVGAPHHRHRWFLRARYVGANAPEVIKIENKCGAPRNGGRVLLPTPTALSYGNNQGGAAGRVGPVRHSLESMARMDLLPSPTTADGGGGPGRSPKRTGGDNLRTAVTLLPQAEHWGKFAGAVALWEEIIGRPAPDPTIPAPRGGRRLNPELSEWMMGYPAGYLTGHGIARNEALKMAGNGVVALQARAAWEQLA